MDSTFLSLAGTVGYVAYYAYNLRKDVAAHNNLVLHHNVTLPNQGVLAKCKTAFRAVFYTIALPLGICKVVKKIFKSIARPALERKLNLWEAALDNTLQHSIFSRGATWLKAQIVNPWKQVQYLDFTSHDGKSIRAIHIPSYDTLSRKVIVQVALNDQAAENQRAVWLSQYSSKANKHALFIVIPCLSGKTYKAMAQDVYSAARQIEKNRKKVTSFMGCDSIGSLIAAKSASMLQKKHGSAKVSAIVFEPIKSFTTLWKNYHNSFLNRFIAVISRVLGFDIGCSNYLKKLKGKIVTVNSKRAPHDISVGLLTKQNAPSQVNRKCKWETTATTTHHGNLARRDRTKIGSLIKANC